MVRLKLKGLFSLLFCLMSFASLHSGTEVHISDKGIKGQGISEESRKQLEKAETAFRQGLDLWSQNEDLAKAFFDKSSTYYKLLSETELTEHPRIFYNLGNAYFFSGSLGKAIHAFQSGLKIDPYHPELRRHLNFVLAERSDRMPKAAVPYWHWPFFWPVILQIETNFELFYLMMFSLFCFILALSFFKQGLTQHKAFRAYTLLLLLLSLQWATCKWSDAYKVNAVLVGSDVQGRQGPAMIYEASFNQNLSEGWLAKVIKQERNWVYIQLESGEKTWIQGKHLWSW